MLGIGTDCSRNRTMVFRSEGRDVKVGKDDWRMVLNAVYLPNNGEALLYDSISPANTFRVIFNHYFDTNFDLLED